MRDAWFRGHRLRAIVFDIDGTLYRQGPLRRAMALRLLAAHAGRPLTGWRTFTALRAYRAAQEHLRGTSGDIAAEQIRLTCERTSLDRGSVTKCVERWMEQEPLALLAKYIQPGVVEFLGACRARGLRLGALSDYPADAKLRALGLAHFFDVALYAQAPEIGAFKPHPRGLQVTLERLGSTPADSLYVGDRVDVDAGAARAGGVPCVILTDTQRSEADDSYVPVASYSELQTLLFSHEPVSSVRDFNRIAQ